jgi:ribosomal-protein-alanine N-acetyltransferase
MSSLPHTNTPQIRPATLDDLDGILAVQEASSGAAQWPRAVYTEILQTGASHASGPCRRVFCALQGDLVLGHATVTAWPMAGNIECELENLAVDPNWRRQGVGRKLMEAVFAWCREQKATQLTLEVRQSNSAAIGLYRQLGLRTVGHRPRYYSAPEEDAVLMARPLSGT